MRHAHHVFLYSTLSQCCTYGYPTNHYWTITGTGVQIGSEVNDAATECFTDGAGDYDNYETAHITAMQSGTLISHTGEIYLFI